MLVGKKIHHFESRDLNEYSYLNYVLKLLIFIKKYSRISICRICFIPMRCDFLNTIICRRK